MDARIDFIQRWFNRQSEDNFDKFFSLWLCLVCIAKFWHSHSQPLELSSKHDDGWFIDKYFKNQRNAESIINSVEKNKLFLKLVTRKSEEGDYIVGKNDISQSDSFGSMYNYYKYTGSTQMNVIERSKTLGLILRAIRNNLFHGRKIYDSTADIELLNIAVPVLQEIIISCAKLDPLTIDLTQKNV